MSETPSTLTIKGSCHCGHIKYQFTTPADPTTHKIFRCNCTYCQKLGTTNFHLSDPSAFTLLSPEAGRSAVADYQTNTKTIHRYFCATCGVHVWMEGVYEHAGHKIPLFVVNLATVEQPQEGMEVSQVKIQYWDGLNNNFAGGSKDRPWPGGLV